MKTDIFGESIAESQPSPETEETIFSEVDEAEEGQEGDTEEQGTPERDNPHRNRSCMLASLRTRTNWNRVILT